jgi:hypothetical protein
MGARLVLSEVETRHRIEIQSKFAAMQLPPDRRKVNPSASLRVKAERSRGFNAWGENHL